MVSSVNTVVHPTSAYVGMKSDLQFVNLGEDFKFTAVTSTPEGAFTGYYTLLTTILALIFVQ